MCESFFDEEITASAYIYMVFVVIDEPSFLPAGLISVYYMHLRKYMLIYLGYRFDYDRHHGKKKKVEHLRKMWDLNSGGLVE